MKELFEHTSPRPLTSVAEAHHPLLEPSLFYDPPYDRPLEDEFAWHLVKYLNPISGLRYQVKAQTPCANVWIDFVVEHGGRRIGFEIGDLEEAKDDDAQQTRYRDALLLGVGAVDVLYRFRGADLYHRLHDCLRLVCQWEEAGRQDAHGPGLFSPRGHINLERLASPEARAWQPPRSSAEAQVVYTAPEETGVIEDEAFAWPAGEPSALVVRRLSRDDLAAWMRDYDEALAHYGVEDPARSAWRKSA